MIPHHVVLLAVVLGSMQGSIGGLIICKHFETAGILKVLVLAASLVIGIVLGFLEVGLFYRSNQKKK